MNTHDLNIVLEGIILCTALTVFFVRDAKIKKLAHWSLLASGTIFVILMLTATSSKRVQAGPAQAVMDLSQVEFSMRMEGAFKGLGDSNNKLMKSPDGQSDKLKVAAVKSMNKAVEKAPDSLPLQFENAILSGELGQSFSKPVKAMQENADKRGPQGARIIENVYQYKRIPDAELDSTIAYIKDVLKPGWFKEVAELEVYRVAGAKKLASQAQKAYDESCQKFLLNLIVVALAGCGALLVGVIVVLCQLFFLPRHPSTDQELVQVRSPVDYGALTVYGVFVGWLVLEGVIGQIMAASIQPLKNPQPVIVPLVTMTLYLLTNGPALIFVWLLALKPNKVRFVNGVKLFFRTPNKGPFGLVLTGVLTWFACVPLVLLSQISKLFGNTEGSSNPILSVIMNSAHHADLLTGFLFVLAVGVLPGLCEEILFRGFLYSYLRRHFGALISMILSAALFAGVHLDGGAFLQLFVLGFVFAFTLERQRSIVPCIIAHALWNSSTFLIILLLFGA